MREIKINEISVNEYLAIREKVKWKKLLPKQAELALANSLHVVGVYEENELIAMGRVVGDGAVICYIQDLIVVPEYQGMKIGSVVLENLISFVEGLRSEHSEMMLCLMCAKGREGFYESHGFIPRPTENLGPGMIQYLH